MNRRSVWTALMVGMAATAGAANLHALQDRPAIVQQSPRSASARKKSTLPGFGPGYQRRSTGLPVTAAEQKRRARKHRNQLRHKRHCRR